MLTVFKQATAGRPWVLPLAAAAALVVLFINESSFQRGRETMATAVAHAEARTQVQNVLRLLLDAETGQRGYLLTARDEYLQPYEQALGEVKGTLDKLSAFYADDPEAHALMEDLHQRGLEKMSELSQTIELYRNGRENLWRELLLTNIGREKMETVRTTADKLFALENQRVTGMRHSLERTIGASRIGVNAMTALCLLALFLFMRQTAALETSRRLHSEALQRERDQLEVEVGRRTAELKNLAAHLESAREDERSHLARELHDELGALLTAAKLDAARLKRGLGAMTPDVGERLAHLNATIDKGIALKRNIIENLRPSSLSNLGLVPALDIQAREFAKRSDIRVVTHLTPVPLSESAQITVYRLVQESLTNIAKYAEAGCVTLTLAPENNGARVSVRDDGLGFDPTATPVKSHGLFGMRHRVESEGGSMRVASSPGQGALIEAWLPRSEEPASEDDSGN